MQKVLPMNAMIFLFYLSLPSPIFSILMYSSIAFVIDQSVNDKYRQYVSCKTQWQLLQIAYYPQMYWGMTNTHISQLPDFLNNTKLDSYLAI